MKKPYKALRILMTLQDWDQVEVGRIIGKSDRCVRARLAGQISWEVDEGYKILAAAQLPDSDFPKYFPRNPMETVNF